MVQEAKFIIDDPLSEGSFMKLEPIFISAGASSTVLETASSTELKLLLFSSSTATLIDDCSTLSNIVLEQGPEANQIENMNMHEL